MGREETLFSALVSRTHFPPVNDEYSVSVDLHFPRNTQEISEVVPLELQGLDRNKCQGLSGFFLQDLDNVASLLDGTDLLTMCSSECSRLFENLLQKSVTTCSQAWISSASWSGPDSVKFRRKKEQIRKKCPLAWCRLNHAAPLKVEESHRGFLASLLSVTTLDSINVNGVFLADGYRRQELRQGHEADIIGIEVRIAIEKESTTGIETERARKMSTLLLHANSTGTLQRQGLRLTNDVNDEQAGGLFFQALDVTQSVDHIITSTAQHLSTPQPLSDGELFVSPFIKTAGSKSINITVIVAAVVAACVVFVVAFAIYVLCAKETFMNFILINCLWAKAPADLEAPAKPNSAKTKTSTTKSKISGNGVAMRMNLRPKPDTVKEFNGFVSWREEWQLRS